MLQVQFATRTRRADLMFILSLWHELMVEWHPDGTAPLDTPMLRRHSKDTLATYLKSALWPDITREQAERACGFDIVLRLASGKIDTMHATDDFFTRADNGNWFMRIDIAAGKTGTTLRGVMLTPEAIAVWHTSTEAQRQQALGDARRLLESDLESDGFAVQLLPPQPTLPGKVALLPVTASRKSCLEALVRAIHQEAYQPMYRKRPCGNPMTGWDARLHGYFWPAPGQGYRATSVSLQTMGQAASGLAESLLAHGTWTAEQGQRAVELAYTIFTWGGVPQDDDTVTAATVEQVFRAALANDKAARANMNSGWTKVAAFATAHLESSDDGRPQAIWDSRVAAAITSRLDAVRADGADALSLFQGVGTVPGRGGTRPRELSKLWPSVYRSWAGQVAGSQVVREIRDILNEGDYPVMPLPEGGGGKWTTRGVEMVLFMDGY